MGRRLALVLWTTNLGLPVQNLSGGKGHFVLYNGMNYFGKLFWVRDPYLIRAPEFSQFMCSFKSGRVSTA